MERAAENIPLEIRYDTQACIVAYGLPAVRWMPVDLCFSETSQDLVTLTFYDAGEPVCWQLSRTLLRTGVEKPEAGHDLTIGPRGNDRLEIVLSPGAQEAICYFTRKVVQSFLEEVDLAAAGVVTETSMSETEFYGELHQYIPELFD